jgi:prepilin-type N-terminal cleavage/methylation domain-containing protein
MSRSNRKGLTLVELAVVVAILAILAGFLAPRIAFIRTLSTHAAAADQIGEVTNNMLTFHATQASWPDGFDTLTDGTALFNTASPGTGLDSALGGALAVSNVDGTGVRSLVWLLSGSRTGSITLYDHVQPDATTGLPLAGDSGLTARTLTAGTAASLALVQGGAAGTTGRRIHEAIYGPANLDAATGLPLDGTRLVALGVGPNCTAVGKTIVSLPTFYMRDPTRYNRAVVLIKIFGTGSAAPGVPPGSQANLAGAVSPTGQTQQSALTDYRNTAAR